MTITTRGTVVIDVEACKGCDLCIDACPPRVLVMTDHQVNTRGYRYPRLLAGCTGCQACAQICPDFVFGVYKYETPWSWPPIPEKSTMPDRDRIDGEATTERALMEGPEAMAERVLLEGSEATIERALMEGPEAMARAAVAAGCRFFAGYPMTPFTGLLEHMAGLLPLVDGVCMNAESELEAVGMAWGAATTGRLAATGSTGQGLSLMQESLSEITNARLPLVVFNMARGQGDYFQATRGGGHGDYRHIVLAPMDVPEAVTLTRLAFALARQWRTPVMVLGDYYLAHTHQAVATPPIDVEAPEIPEWALNGSSGGSGAAKIISLLGRGAEGEEGFDLGAHYAAVAAHVQAMATDVEPLIEVGHCDDAELVVAAYGSVGKFVRYACLRLRDAGYPVGYVRPITLWPFPSRATLEAISGSAKVVVYEQNLGQMVDDVRLAAPGAAPVEFIGGPSWDHSGFGIGPDINVPAISQRILEAMP